MPRAPLPPWIKTIEPYALLVFTTLCWAGNVVAAQIAIGEISPLILTFLRWLMVATCLLAFNGSRLLAAWPVLQPRLGMLAIMAIAGFTIFNSLFYVASHHTRGVNIGIIQGTMPALILLAALVAYRTPVTLVQLLGTLVTVAGVVVVTTSGEISRLASLALNPGDVIMLLACVFYAGYTVSLKRRPQVPAMVFFTVLAVFAAISSLPLAVFEHLNGNLIWPTWQGWLVMLYVSLFPSFLAQVSFIRGVEILGPGRAGLFVNFVPIFAALLSVLLLGEPFRLYHAAALALVLGGIALAESRKRKTASA